MITLKISIFIILILLILEFYFNYFHNEDDNKTNKKTSNESFENKEKVETKEILNEDKKYKNVEDTQNLIEFKNPNPWCKISINKDDYTKYYIKLNNFKEDKYLEWKKLIDSLDYDIETKELILETKEEYEALALVNLIISNMNEDIDLEEVINNKLITISIQKAKKHKLVCNKLKELITENNKSPEEKNFDTTIQFKQDYNDDMSKYEEIEISLSKNNDNNKEDFDSNTSCGIANNPEKVFSNSVNSKPEQFEPIPYGGLEYALL